MLFISDKRTPKFVGTSCSPIMIMFTIPNHHKLLFAEATCSSIHILTDINAIMFTILNHHKLLFAGAPCSSIHILTGWREPELSWGLVWRWLSGPCAYIPGVMSGTRTPRAGPLFTWERPLNDVPMDEIVQCLHDYEVPGKMTSEMMICLSLKCLPSVTVYFRASCRLVSFCCYISFTGLNLIPKNYKLIIIVHK